MFVYDCVCTYPHFLLQSHNYILMVREPQCKCFDREGRGILEGLPIAVTGAYKYTVLLSVCILYVLGTHVLRRNVLHMAITH